MCCSQVEIMLTDFTLLDAHILPIHSTYLNINTRNKIIIITDPRISRNENIFAIFCPKFLYLYAIIYGGIYIQVYLSISFA